MNDRGVVTDDEAAAEGPAGDARWTRDIATLLLIAAIAQMVVWLLGFVVTRAMALPDEHTTLRLNNLLYGGWVVLVWLLAVDARRGPSQAGLAATVATGALWLGGLVSSVVGFTPAWLSVNYVASVVASAALVGAAVFAFGRLRASAAVFVEPSTRGPGWALRLGVLITGLIALALVELPLDTGGVLGLVDVLQQPAPLDLVLSAALRTAGGLSVVVAAGVLRPARLGAAAGAVLGLDLAMRVGSSALLASRVDVTGGGFELHPAFLVLVLAVGLFVGLLALLWINVEGDTEPTPKPTLDPEREW